MGFGLQFRCIQGCNDCCMWRGYQRISGFNAGMETKDEMVTYDKTLGKEGVVEIEAWELPKVIKLIRKMRNRVDENGRPIDYKILPARGVSAKGKEAPEIIISYWLMGRDENGDICPFLSTTTENQRTVDGALRCLIYEDRPLRCRAYPLREVFVDGKTGIKMAWLDVGCQWVIENLLEGKDWLKKPFPLQRVRGIDYGATIRLQSRSGFDVNTTTLWAYATGVYGKSDQPPEVYIGWVKIGQD